LRVWAGPNFQKNNLSAISHPVIPPLSLLKIAFLFFKRVPVSTHQISIWCHPMTETEEGIRHENIKKIISEVEVVLIQIFYLEGRKIMLIL